MHVKLLSVDLASLLILTADFDKHFQLFDLSLGILPKSFHFS